MTWRHPIPHYAAWGIRHNLAILIERQTMRLSVAQTPFTG